MFPNWDKQVKDCNSNVDKIVELHVERWARWNDYIKALGYEEKYRVERDMDEVVKKLKEVKIETTIYASGKAYNTMIAQQAAKQLQIDFADKLKGAWSKILLEKDDNYIFLDASFGSMNTTSDLDVNVVSTTRYAMEVWMSFTSAWVDKKKGQSFCEYWDSNFYYEPGVFMREGTEVNGEALQRDEVVSIPKLFMDKKFAWTSPKTAMYELHCVEAYANAYSRNKDILIDGFRSSPNPFQCDKEKEQNCYRSALHFAEAFRRVCDSYEADPSPALADMVRFAYLKYAVTKIEGLVSVTSLAICKVFGDNVFHEFVSKKKRGGYVKGYMAGIAAYEMLRNLDMHSKEGKYKSKYANRLQYALSNVPGLCDMHGREMRYEKDPITKSNTAALIDIESAIAFLLDYMDGEVDYGDDSCKFLKEKTRWRSRLKKKLPELCRMTKEYVEGYIKESTNVRAGKDQEKEATDYVKNLIVE